MDLRKLSVRNLRGLLSEFSHVSLGLKDIIFIHAIQDELTRRGKSWN